MPNGKYLERGLFEEVKQFFLPKTKVFEAQEFGWGHEKIEGVAIIDNQTIAVINDNDFGYDDYKKLTSSKEGYKFRLTTKKLDQRKTEIWVVHFDESLVN